MVAFEFSQLIIIDDEAQCYISKLLKEFEENPFSPRFHHTVRPPLDGIHLPSIFIWSPLEQFKFEKKILCPVHGSFLKVGFWTDNVAEASGHRNPRLAYDIDENIVLIQRSYICKHRHR